MKLDKDTIKFAVLFFFVTIATIAALVICCNEPDGLCEVVYTVERGDTLNQIVEIYCPDDIDSSKYFRMVRERNDLDDNYTIYEGQQLVVFIYED